MSGKTLSSVVTIKTHDFPAEVMNRYGLFDDDLILRHSRASVSGNLDHGIKDVDSALTGLRHGHHSRRYFPGDLLITSRPSRRHSYIEPRLIHSGTLHYSAEEPKNPEQKPPLSSTLWYYTEPYTYPYYRRYFSPYTPGQQENRILAEYKDVRPGPVPSKWPQRWSMYGSPPSRSISTPPDTIYRPVHVQHPVVDRLARRKNHEFEVGLKLAESHTELDKFDRLLDKKFGNDRWRTSSHRVYPWWLLTPDYTYPHYPLYYDYRLPTTDYRYTMYSPPTRVTRPPELSSTVYSYSGYTPTSSSSLYTRHVPTSFGYSTYSPTTFTYEPWYTPYYSRSYYSGYPLERASGYYTTRYLL